LEFRRVLFRSFVLLNLAGLAPDIYLAHSTNQFGARSPTAFGRRIEYLPLYFSPAAAAVLLAAVVLREAWGREGAWRLLGHLVGWAAVAVGVAGLVLHLRSQFFQRWTLASPVYSAPFAAPLASAGLG